MKKDKKVKSKRTGKFEKYKGKYVMFAKFGDLYNVGIFQGKKFEALLNIFPMPEEGVLGQLNKLGLTI